MKLRLTHSFEGFLNPSVWWIVCCAEERRRPCGTLSWSVVSCSLQEIRRRYGVYGTEALVKVLMFMEKSEEKVVQSKRMLEEMWRTRRIERL